jgi:hypothetical protein
MAQGIFNLKQVNQAIRQGAWSAFNPPQFVEYLVVAGGGGATNGGGGAGGLLTGMIPVTAGSSYTVTVGGGGAGQLTGAFLAGTNGTASVFGPISAAGGGGGGSQGGTGDYGAGQNGGSGGGQGFGRTTISNYVAGQGIAGQGNAGALGHSDLSTYTKGGGGGGAGTIAPYPGDNISGGDGGAGIASSISGTVTVYAGGGAGAGGAAASQARGGVGGGGGSVYSGAPGISGNPTSGGGGGGSNGNPVSGSGGSGIVIVRYPGSIQFYTGGAVTYANGHVVHTFHVTDTLAPTTPTAIATSEYQISRSLRFNTPDGVYLTRTPATATNRKTWTWSGWIKRGLMTARNDGFFGSVGASDYLQFGSDFSLTVSAYNNINYFIQTTQLFRDPSAWYHIVVGFDTTQATASNRIKLYVNGAQVTAFATSNYPTQNYDTDVNNNSIHYIGTNTYNSFDGYMTEVNLIDGQQLTPSSFGATNSNTGVWGPKAYTGTYGTNGFYLNFSDNSNTTAATLGKDYSGNGNNWTPNNFSVTAGVGNDSLLDTPTPYGTDTGLGGEVRGNYCTLNPLVKPYGTNLFSNGNLAMATDVSNWNIAVGTISMTTGKWYWEFVSGEQQTFFGIQTIGQNYTAINPQNFTGTVLVCDDNQKIIDGTRSAYTATGHGAGVVVGVAVDMDSGSITFYKNGTSQGAIAFGNGMTGKAVVPVIIPYYSGYTHTVNFGQRPFTYPLPGYKALCATNLPAPRIGFGSTSLASKFFNTVLWTGDGAQTRSITGVGFQPDWTWMKIRADTPQDHQVYDVVRGAGAGKALATNTSAAEGTVNGYTDTDYGYLSSFNSDGFSVNDGAVATTGGYVNYSGRTYVAWNWKAGGTAVTNTAGSLTSQVSANPAAGFSVVTYTGNAASAQTIGHGLGVAPSMIIVRGRTGGNWPVYHKDGGVNQYMFLNSTAAFNTVTGYWGSVIPTDTVFGVIGGGYGNNSGTAVAYCFAEVAGYSAIGSYTGNGSSSGPFVFTNMQVAFLMIKCTDTAGTDWAIYDNKRNTYNTVNTVLEANLTLADYTSTSLVGINFLSNGFRLIGTDNGVNGSSKNYIYMAFAQNPFKYSLAR